jgi:hypothetical protein
MDAEVKVASAMAKTKVCPFARSTIRLRQQMLDGRFPPNLQATEIHRMTAPPAIVAVSFA